MASKAFQRVFFDDSPADPELVRAYEDLVAAFKRPNLGRKEPFIVHVTGPTLANVPSEFKSKKDANDEFVRIVRDVRAGTLHKGLPVNVYLSRKGKTLESVKFS